MIGRAEVVLMFPVDRQGARHEVGARLTVPADEAAALVRDRLAVPAGAELLTDRRRIRGEFLGLR